MDKEKLFNGVIAEEIARNKLFAKKDVRTNKRRSHNERLSAPFKELEARNRETRRAAKDFVKDGKTWRTSNKSKQPNVQGVLVVIGEAPKSKLTQDHVAVCLVSYDRPDARYPDEKLTDPYDEGVIRYRFAFIPNSALEDTLKVDGYPLGKRDMHFTTSPEQRLWRDEFIPKNDTVGSAGNQFHRAISGTNLLSWIETIGYRSALAETEADVKNAEDTLVWLVGLASDPELNPHLSQNANSVRG